MMAQQTPVVERNISVAELATDNVEVAMVIAAMELTKQSTGNLADEMAERYKMFYKTISEAYRSPS